MNWIEGQPSEQGLYFVHAPSADPNKPLFATAWFSDGRWSLLPAVWRREITHWMKPERPAP